MSHVKISSVSDFTTFDRTHVVDSIDLSGMKLKYRVVLNTLCDMTFNSPFTKWIDTHSERDSGQVSIEQTLPGKFLEMKRQHYITIKILLRHTTPSCLSFKPGIK